SPRPARRAKVTVTFLFATAAVGLVTLFELSLVSETTLLLLLLTAAGTAVLVASWYDWAAAFEATAGDEVPPPFDLVAIWPLDETGLERAPAAARQPDDDED